MKEDKLTTEQINELIVADLNALQAKWNIKLEVTLVIRHNEEENNEKEEGEINNEQTDSDDTASETE